jgi:hypothetical protein
MNDFIRAIRFLAEDDPDWTLAEMEDQLYITPCGPLGYNRPAERTRKLLREACGSSRSTGCRGDKAAERS